MVHQKSWKVIYLLSIYLSIISTHKRARESIYLFDELPFKCVVCHAFTMGHTQSFTRMEFYLKQIQCCPTSMAFEKKRFELCQTGITGFLVNLAYKLMSSISLTASRFSSYKSNNQSVDIVSDNCRRTTKLKNCFVFRYTNFLIIF